MKEYDVNWITRKGYRSNQYGKVWFITVRAKNISEARQLFDAWWYAKHNYHAFHIQIRPKGKYSFCHPMASDFVRLDEILCAE